MHPADIQAALKKHGYTQKMIARELGITEMPVSRVISKAIVSSRIMCAIAKRINRTPQEVFPEYFLQPPKRRHSKVNV